MDFQELSRRIRLGACAMALLVTASIHAQTVDNEPRIKADVLDKVTQIIKKSAYVPGVDFSKWNDYLADAQPKIDAAKNDEEFTRAVNEALLKFGMTHLDLLSPRSDDTFFTGSVVGIGVTVQRQEDKSMLVVRTAKDAPAERAGIVPGDAITEVDGESIQGITTKILGKAGTDVNITVRHADGVSEHYILTRREYSTVRPEELDWIDQDTAKLTVYTFDYSYNPDNVETLMKDASRAKHLILDLRDNGGGAVVNMKHLLGMLIPEDKPIGVFVDRGLVGRYVKEAGGKASDLGGLAKWSPRKEMPRANRRVPVFTGSIVVLLNSFSGSASEIAAAALRDDVNATVVGSKSAGAVLVSVVVPATNGFGFQYPLSDFVTAKGFRIEGNGIVPDVTVKEPKIRLPSDKDEALEKAIAYITQANKGMK